MEFFELAGFHVDDFIDIRKPSQFRRIYVSIQALNIGSGYSLKYLNTFDTIRNNAYFFTTKYNIFGVSLTAYGVMKFW